MILFSLEAVSDFITEAPLVSPLYVWYRNTFKLHLFISTSSLYRLFYTAKEHKSPKHQSC